MEKNQKKDGKPKIAGSLEDGELYNGAKFAAVYIAFAFTIICAAVLAAAALSGGVSYYLYAAAVPALMAVLIGYFVVDDAVKRVKCAKCLKDGVCLDARCEKIMAAAPAPVKDKTKHIKVCVTFVYKGRQKRVYSGKQGYTGRGSVEKAGFAAINAEYANRDIKIIYSPSRDAVLFLREDKSKPMGLNVSKK